MTGQQQYLVEGIIGDLVVFLVEDKNLELPMAFSVVYNSEFYNKLLDTETGLYLEGSAYNYELLKNELKFGSFS